MPSNNLAYFRESIFCMKETAILFFSHAVRPLLQYSLVYIYYLRELCLILSLTLDYGSYFVVA